MKKIYLLILTGLFLILFSNVAKAQLTGVKNIPGDYANLAAAITDLNTQGVGAGGVTINIIAGNPQTAPAGGYLLGTTTLNAGISASNTITFNGNGNLITAPVGTSTSLDGIFIIRGTDYITINNLNLAERAANTTATTVMEYGYAFFNLNSAAPFDGCQNNTIQNCTVTMKRTVATPSKAIFMAHQVYTSTTGLAPTATADMHNDNRFYTNTLTNCITGIYIGGSTSANDTGNDIGGTSASTGNTINNVIGALYSGVGAITCTYQTNCNISYNTINNTANGGTNAIATAWGIYAYGPSCTYTVNNNNITLTEASSNTGYEIYGIYGNATLANITANNNIVTVSEVSGLAVNNIAVYLPNGNNTTISNNTVTQNMAVNGNAYGIFITSTGTAAINGNTVKQTASVATSTQFYSIISAGTASSESIQNNVFDNSNVSVAGTSGYMTLIYTANGTGNKTISGNYINGTVTHASTSDFYGILDNPASGPAAGTAVFSNNNFSNITKSGTGGLYAIYEAPAAASSRNLRITGNTVSNLTHSGTGPLVGMFYASGNYDSIYNNQVFNLTGGGSVFGIYGSSPAAVNAKIFKNKLYSLSSTAPATGGVFGITVADGTATTVFNNFISDFRAATISNTADAIRGISLLSTAANSTINVYYNSIYLDASSSGANFSTSGIYHTTNATATTAALTMIDNIIVNTSTPSGTGVTAAYRRSNATLTNFASGSDYNLFYAGTPAASRLIFYDGTNSDQTLSAYQTRVSSRDANSISLMPTFTSSTDLHLTPVNCLLDDKGTPVAGITDDIDADTRSTTVPDIGADEFTAYNTATIAGIVNTAVCESKAVANTGTFYKDAGCNLIAKLLPSGGGTALTGIVNACVTRDAAQQYFNGEPYVQRHYDIEPATTPATATATVTLYFTDQEFVDYNTLNPVWPTLPTSGAGNTVANRNNVRITQFHGTPTGGLPTTTPGNYTGTRLLITPGAANVVWNGNYWAVTFPVTGFSGFYAHSTLTNAPLPVTVNYLNGRKQGSNHLLDWKVTCVSTPRATMTLERSSDARNFAAIYTITADAARCAQPFDHTDVNPLKGMNYYRLKIVDADGKLTYSTTVALLNAVKGFDIISIAPNPVVSNTFKLNLASAQAGKMEFGIFDMQGRLVKRESITVIAGFNSLPVNVANLSAGTYTIRSILTDDQSKVIRFVKQ